MTTIGGVPGRSSCGLKRTADGRRDAKHVEETRGDDRPLHLLGVARSGQVASPQSPAADGVEGARLRAQIVEVGLREGQLRLVVLRLAAPDEDEPVLRLERQRVQDDAVHDGEHRRDAADPDGQGQDGDQWQRAGVTKAPRGVTKVLQHVMTCKPAACQAGTVAR